MKEGKEGMEGDTGRLKGGIEGREGGGGIRNGGRKEETEELREE